MGYGPYKLGKFIRWLMPNGGTLLIALLLILTQQVWAVQSQRDVLVPGPSAYTVSYQGTLEDSSGNPVNDPSVTMTFSIWDSLMNGIQKWGPEIHPDVAVTDGLFTVGLGTIISGGIPTSVWDGDRYLQINVEGETLTPRQLIRSVPIAGLALTVPDGAITSQKMAPSVFDAYRTTQLNVTPTETLVVSVVIDIPVDATYLILVRVSSEHNQGNAQIQSYVRDENSNTLTGTTMYTFHTMSGSPGAFTNSISTVADFSAGAHTLNLYATTSGGTGNVRSAHLIVIPFHQAP